MKVEIFTEEKIPKEPYVIFTVGPSASGKTTWANEYKSKHHDVQIICRDDIRKHVLYEKTSENFSWKHWQWKWEKEVSTIQSAQIDAAIIAKRSVIVADTNLNESRMDNLARNFDSHDYQIFIKEFDVPFKILVERDNARANGVGQSVIARQIEDFRNRKVYINPNQHLIDRLNSHPRNCFICDIDGTIADSKGIRSPYDLSRVHLDRVVPETLRLLEGLSGVTSTGMCAFTSGREGTPECREATMKWLHENVSGHMGGHDWWLFMRHAGDSRPDDVVKLELLDEMMNEGWYPAFAIDDRPRVIRAWRSIGLFTFAVGNPDIDF